MTSTIKKNAVIKTNFLFLINTGGCKSLATNKSIKTAYQSEFSHTQTHPRLPFSVWSPTDVAIVAALTRTTRKTQKTQKTTYIQRNCGSCRRRRRIQRVLTSNLIFIMTIVTIFTSALAAPTTTTTNSSANNNTQPTHTQSVTGTRKANTSAKNKAVGVTLTQNTIDVSSGMVYTMVQTQNEGSRKRKRHSKRHSDWNIDTLKDLPWVNPCGGFYVPLATQGGGGSAMRRKNPKQVRLREKITMQ